MDSRKFHLTFCVYGNCDFENWKDINSIRENVIILIYKESNYRKIMKTIDLISNPT